MNARSTSPPALDFGALWEVALPYQAFVGAADRNRELWAGVYRVAQVPAWARARVAAQSRAVRLLVIAEDWCGDAVNTLPVLAKLAEQEPGVEMRVLRRDEHLDLMDQYLTRGARAIPIVIVLDADFGEHGHWGPRPAALQAWVMANKDTMSKDERYREVRRWYAKDRGASTLREVLALLPTPPT